METIKEKAEALLENSEVVVLTSVNKEGYPKPVPMSKIKSEGLSAIWFATGRNSLKTKDFRLNPNGGVCFYEKGNSVALTGEVEIVTDKTMKEALWQDWFIEHFTKGATDPDYILLKFKPNHATLWIDGVFVHKKLK